MILFSVQWAWKGTFEISASILSKYLSHLCKDDSSFKDGSPRFRTKPVLHFWLNWQWLPSVLRWVDCCRWRPCRPRRCRGCRRCKVCRTGFGVGDQILDTPEKKRFLFDSFVKKFKHGKNSLNPNDPDPNRSSYLVYFVCNEYRYRHSLDSQK